MLCISYTNYIQGGSFTMMKIYAKVYPVEPKEGSDSKLLAFANLELGASLKVNDVRINRGPDGPFVSMPSYKTHEGEYKDFCHPTTKEFREAIAATVLDAYKRASKVAVKEGDTNPFVEVSVTKFEKDSIRALGHFTLGKEFQVNNVTVRENVNGKLFVTMPGTSYEKDGERKFRDICVPVGDKEKMIVGGIINAAKAKLAEKEPLDAQVASAEVAKKNGLDGAEKAPKKAEKAGRD